MRRGRHETPVPARPAGGWLLLKIRAVAPIHPLMEGVLSLARRRAVAVAALAAAGMLSLWMAAPSAMAAPPMHSVPISVAATPPETTPSTTPATSPPATSPPATSPPTAPPTGTSASQPPPAPFYPRTSTGTVQPPVSHGPVGGHAGTTGTGSATGAAATHQATGSGASSAATPTHHQLSLPTLRDEAIVLTAGRWRGVSLRAATTLSVPLAFGVAVALFVLLQALIDRRDPKLARAPERGDDDRVAFR